MPIPAQRLHDIACTCDRCNPLTPRQQLLVRAFLGAVGLVAVALLSLILG